jgi:hypothetical protein
MNKEKKLRSRVIQGLKRDNGLFKSATLHFSSNGPIILNQFNEVSNWIGTNGYYLVPNNIEIKAMIIINNVTGEMKMSSNMPMKNNIAFLKYARFKENEKKL